jgi:hypothetical protein
MSHFFKKPLNPEFIRQQAYDKGFREGTVDGIYAIRRTFTFWQRLKCATFLMIGKKK